MLTSVQAQKHVSAPSRSSRWIWVCWFVPYCQVERSQYLLVSWMIKRKHSSILRERPCICTVSVFIFYCVVHSYSVGPRRHLLTQQKAKMVTTMRVKTTTNTMKTPEFSQWDMVFSTVSRIAAFIKTGTPRGNPHRPKTERIQAQIHVLLWIRMNNIKTQTNCVIVVL